MSTQRRTLVQRFGYRLLQIYSQVAGSLFFQIRCFGRENYPDQGGVLVCANHQSHLDPVLVGLTCNRRMNYVARKTLFDYAALRALIRFLDAIPIDRDGMGISGIKETLRRLKREELVLIFPEGTRSPDGEMSPLKPGFCALARRGRVPIVPVGLDGAFDAWPRSAPLPRPSCIHLHIGPAITPEEIQQMSDDQLIEEVNRRMTECHRRARCSRSAH